MTHKKNPISEIITNPVEDTAGVSQAENETRRLLEWKNLDQETKQETKNELLKRALTTVKRDKPAMYVFPVPPNVESIFSPEEEEDEMGYDEKQNRPFKEANIVCLIEQSLTMNKL